jgi:hypothetical protein
MKDAIDYFEYLLSILLPGIYPEKLSLTAFKNANELHNLRCANRRQAHTNLFYLKDHKSIEKISIGRHPEFSVFTNIDAARSIGDTLALNSAGLADLATFPRLEMPAILLDKRKEILYFLFDLEELVCKTVKLDDEQNAIDRHGRFKAEFHQEMSRWKLPVIEVVGACIRQGLDLPGSTQNYGVLMTHDVDRVGRDFFLLFKKLIKNETPRLSFHPGRDSLYESIKKLIGMDSQNEIQSVWFFLSGYYSVRRYGNRYNSHSRKTKTLVADIVQTKHSIGLHTSYYNAFNGKKCRQEKNNLEKLCNRPVLINRNHYLRFNAKLSIDLLENCGFTADASLGFSDANGFRSGLCRPFRPWNHKRQRISKILEIPLVFMDSVNENNLEKSWDDFLRVINWVKDVRGCASILFHPCSIGLNPEMHSFYLSAINELKRLNIPLLSLDEVLAKSRRV